MPEAKIASILSYGGALRSRAKHLTDDVNQSYLLVHDVMMRAFDGTSWPPASELESSLSREVVTMQTVSMLNRRA